MTDRIAGHWEYDSDKHWLNGVCAYPQAYVEFGGDVRQIAELCRRLGELAKEKAGGRPIEADSWPIEPPADPTGVDCAERWEGIDG